MREEPRATYRALPPEAAKSINIPSYEELLREVSSRILKTRDCSSRLETVFNMLYSRTSGVESLYRVYKTMHSFYLDLLSTEISLEEIEKAFSCVFKARKLSRRFWDTYRYRVLASSTAREACREAREGVGRMLSLFRRCRRMLLTLKNAAIYLSKLPSVDTSAPIVIIAGAPNAGKSTFVRAVSTGKPEVASYPFTTKNVTLGHRVVDGFKVQFIDTPGLLDRPIEEMNKIERRAVAALSRLTGSVFFLFDPSPGAYLSLRAQRDLFVNVLKMIENKPVFIGINKVDEATPALLEESRRIALEFVKSGVAIKSYELSAIDKEAAEAVAEDLCRETLRLLGFRP